MAVNVGQALLHDTENHQFHIARKPAEILRNAEADLDAAALGERTRESPIPLPSKVRPDAPLTR
jgi:hypothetical protein